MPLRSIRMLLSTKSSKKCWQRCGKTGIPASADRNVKWGCCYEEKVENRITTWADNPQKNWKGKQSQRDFPYSQYSPVLCSIIHNNQKVGAMQVATNEWINKMWSGHTIEYCQTQKRKEIPMHATIRMNFENII